MDWITQQIAIGNFIDAENAAEAEIDAILCLKTGCCDENNEYFDVLCLPLTDGSGNSRMDISDAIDFIDDVVSDGEKILVHCHAGRSRSVCIVARYLMMKQYMTREQALNRIESIRDIFLSPGIEELLTTKL